MSSRLEGNMLFSHCCYTFVDKLRDRLFLCKVSFKENLGFAVIKLFYLIFVTHFSILNSDISSLVLQQTFFKTERFAT